MLHVLLLSEIQAQVPGSEIDQSSHFGIGSLLTPTPIRQPRHGNFDKRVQHGNFLRHRVSQRSRPYKVLMTYCHNLG